MKNGKKEMQFNKNNKKINLILLPNKDMNTIKKIFFSYKKSSL